MCLIIPGKISKISKNGFLIDYGKVKTRIVNSLVDNIRTGDWVIVQNKFVVQKLTEQQANSFFKLTK